MEKLDTVKSLFDRHSERQTPLISGHFGHTTAVL